MKMSLTVEWKIASSDLAGQLAVILFRGNQKPYPALFTVTVVVLVVLPALIPLSF